MLYGVNEESVTQILEYYSLATEYDKYWYKVSREFLKQTLPCHQVHVNFINKTLIDFCIVFTVGVAWMGSNQL